MHEWRFVDATDRERQAFADLDALLAAGVPVAPPNRLRHVCQVQHDGRLYYLKHFMRRQAKNRWFHRFTAPRAHSDAERELAVALALRARGVGVARPVAVGRRGAASFYLCAEVAGTSLRDLWLRARLPPRLLRAAGRFAGGVTGRGVALPDLSAEHVFVVADAPARFAVIDLHNGRLCRRAGRRIARRVLRRFQRSVRDLDVPARRQLEFALALLRAMGLGRDARALLSALPNPATHSRYEEQERARSYRDRSPPRHRRELECLRRVWPGRAGDVVLDAPCGTGRLAPALRALGAEPVAADRARAMLAEVRDPARRVVADLTALPFADRSVDGTVVFRLLHHLEPAAARLALAEAARVSRRYLVVSFFHPCAPHGLQRRLRAAFSRRAPTRHSLTHGRLRSWLAALGFAPVRCVGELPFVRELWVASFARRE